MRQVNWLACHPIEFELVQLRENIGRNSSRGDGFPWTHDEIGEHHHPASNEADLFRKYFGSVGNLAGSIGHAHDELAIDVADGEQQSAPDRETEDGAERAATSQPVVHNDEPANSHHGSPTQGEVVGDAKLACQLGRLGGCRRC